MEITPRASESLQPTETELQTEAEIGRQNVMNFP